MINRRNFLKYAGQGMLLLSGMSFIHACSGLKRSDLAGLKDQDGILKGLEKDEMEILYLASLAPSGHNTQPWTVKLPAHRAGLPGKVITLLLSAFIPAYKAGHSADFPVKVVELKHWMIGSDKRRWLPAVGPENRELLLSLGAFIENLTLAAGTFGYRVEVQIIAKNRTDTEIAEIQLKKDKPKDFPLEKIRKRRTVRSNFLDEEMKEEDLKYITKHDIRSCPAMARVRGGFPRHSFYFPKNSPQGKYLQEGTIEANRTQAFRDAAQEELANWIRWSNKEGKKYRNGLTPESMEIKGVAGFYVRNFYHRQSVLKKSFREQTVDIAAKQAKAGGGWLVITLPDSSVSALIEYGRVFENILLKIREKMIAIHPMTQILEEEYWKNKVTKELGLSGEVQWILRIGYLKSYPDPVSLRMPVSWFIQT